MSIYKPTTPFENRYKTHRILHYGKPYSDYKTYTIKTNPLNKEHILAIHIDNQFCANIPTNKSLLTDINETTSLINTKLINKRFVEIEYTPEQNKPKLEYIMTDDDINELLSKYGYVMK